MKKLVLTLCATALLGAFTTLPALAQDMKPVMVGGASMFPNKDIIDNAVNSKDHTTLVAAVKAAGLVDTLKSAGPFTVFAPVNDAFAALPAGTLTKVLTDHVVPGRFNAAELSKQIGMGNGRAMLKTASGGTLVASISGSDVMITDENGGSAKVTIPDVNQSHGGIHVGKKGLLPK